MVLPVYDANPTRRRPIVTYALIAANVVAFLASPVALTVLGTGTSIVSLCNQQAFFDHWAAIPVELLRGSAQDLVTGQAVGPMSCELVTPGYDKVPALSVLTAMFLHGGWLHLGGNMLFLYVFGNNVEDRFGRVRYLIFYLACGYAATYAFALSMPSSAGPTLGASGAIAGVLGAYLVLYPRARVISLLPFLFFLPVRLPAWLVLGGWFVLQYLYYRGAAVAQAGSVAYLAHVAGFLVGLAVVLVWRPRERRAPPAALPPYGRGYA